MALSNTVLAEKYQKNAATVKWRWAKIIIFIQLKLEDRILELQQLNTTDLQKENEAKDAEISELKEKTFVSLHNFFSSSSAA